MKGKIKTIMIALLIATSLGGMLALGDTATITGSFTPTSTVSAVLWNTTIQWGSLGVSASATNGTMINNTGDTNIDVTIKYLTQAINLTQVTGSPGMDQYMAQYNDSSGNWNNITSGYTAIMSNLTSLTGKCAFSLKVTMGTSFSKTWGQQYYNTSIQYVAHT